MKHPYAMSYRCTGKKIRYGSFQAAQRRADELKRKDHYPLDVYHCAGKDGCGGFHVGHPKAPACDVVTRLERKHRHINRQYDDYRAAQGTGHDHRSDSGGAADPQRRHHA